MIGRIPHPGPFRALLLLLALPGYAAAQPCMVPGGEDAGPVGTLRSVNTSAAAAALGSIRFDPHPGWRAEASLGVGRLEVDTGTGGGIRAALMRRGRRGEWGVCPFALVQYWQDGLDGHRGYLDGSLFQGGLNLGVAVARRIPLGGGGWYLDLAGGPEVIWWRQEIAGRRLRLGEALQVHIESIRDDGVHLGARGTAVVRWGWGGLGIDASRRPGPGDDLEMAVVLTLGNAG